ncbi:hypothetical protein ACW5R3_11205 [Bizionia sp. KMM 8389]
MTETLISLISIAIGIIGANVSGYVFKKHSFGVTGNTIAGVFGSILLIKSFGRLGFDPLSIVYNNSLNSWLFIINVTVSFVGGFVSVLFISKLKNKMSQDNNN